MKLQIIYSSFLRRTVAPVTVFDSELKKEADEMVRMMKSHHGLGLAANQVGLDKQLIVLGYEPQNRQDELPRIPLMQLCNPRVVKFSQEKDEQVEGCLSLPGLELPVVRSSGVVVEAQDLTGKPVKIKAKGLLARILQHEIDHLNGVLFTDRTKNYRNVADYGFAKIVFFGSDEFSTPVFNSLLDSGLNVIAAVTETAKPAGRGQKLTEPLIKQVAEERGVAVFQPADKAEITKIVSQLKPDLIVLASYGKILPAETLSIPLYGSLNVHPSLLPKYRGATPLQTALLNGDAETGVTIMTMSPAVDAGEIVAQKKVEISTEDTFLTLREKLAEEGAHLLINSIPSYLAGKATLDKQDPELVVATKKLTKEMGEINWEDPAEQIDRQIRALNPWPGTFTWLNGKRLKVLRAHLNGAQLQLDEVQLEGKNPTNWPDFVRGYHNQLTKETWYGKITK